MLLSAPRRSPAIPNPSGTKALYTCSTYSFDSHSSSSELCVLDIKTGSSKQITTDDLSNPNWLSSDGEIVWLSQTESGNTKVVVGSVDEPEKTYLAGTVPGPVSDLKLQPLSDGRIAFCASGKANPDGSLFNPKDEPKALSSAKVYDSIMVRHWDQWVTPQRNSLWYGVFERTPSPATEETGRYVLSSLTNALKGSSLESPVPPFGGTDSFVSELQQEMLVVCLLTIDDRTFPRMGFYLQPKTQLSIRHCTPNVIFTTCLYLALQRHPKANRNMLLWKLSMVLPHHPSSHQMAVRGPS